MALYCPSASKAVIYYRPYRKEGPPNQRITEDFSARADILFNAPAGGKIYDHPNVIDGTYYAYAGFEVTYYANGEFRNDNTQYYDRFDGGNYSDNQGTLTLSFMVVYDESPCVLQDEEQSYEIEKPYSTFIEIEASLECWDIYLDPIKIKSLCSDVGCPRPEIKVACDPTLCPDGTCCECIDGDYKCCYNSQGIAIKRFKFK